MEPKKRRLFVLAIAVTIIAGVLASFGLPFFYQTPSISLPNLDSDGMGDVTNLVDPEGTVVPITVTKENVQAVIASLQRSNSYYRSIAVERWGSHTGETGIITTIHIWKQNNLERSAIIFPDGTTQNRLTDGEMIYIWHTGDRNYHAYPATQREADLAQEMPTYETVVNLNPEDITNASYEDDMIYVECNVSSLNFLERYWVSAETGLLVAAETIDEDGRLKYRMGESGMSYDMGERLEDEPNLFTLPDQTPLY